MRRLGIFIIVFLAFGCNSTTTSEGNLDEGSIQTGSVPKSPEGWVELSFDINESGEPANIKVLDTNAGGLLDKEAVRALEKWKYKPKIVDGVAVVQKDLKVRLDFTIDDES